MRDWRLGRSLCWGCRLGQWLNRLRLLRADAEKEAVNLVNIALVADFSGFWDRRDHGMSALKIKLAHKYQNYKFYQDLDPFLIKWNFQARGVPHKEPQDSFHDLTLFFQRKLSADSCLI